MKRVVVVLEEGEVEGVEAVLVLVEWRWLLEEE